MKFNDINVGHCYESKKIITDEMVREFARITGDNNPVHLDEEFAKNSIFEKRIAHGILVLGLISSVLGMEFPGPGTIYLKQDTMFRAPVYLNEEITIELEVLEKYDEKSRLRISTNVIKENGKAAIKGEALVLFKENI